MKKRIVGTLMALLLAATVLPPGAISVTSADVTSGLVTTAYAAEHQNHCICGAEHNDGIKTHTRSDVVNYNRAITVSSRNLYYGNTQCALKKWDSSKSQYVNGTNLSDAEYYVLPAGNYYIDNDITTIKTILIESGTVNICLNGKKITLDGYYHGNAAFKVLQGATLNLTDCAETSAISAADSGRGVVVYGTLNLYSGNITKSNRQTGAGAGVYVGASGVFNMYGGKITNNRATSTGGGGVYNLGTFNMYEGAEISGNYANTSTSLDAGGVYNKGGTFTMYGGMITNNGSGKANNDNGFDVDCGGGVYVYGGSFIMKGGTISGNTARESGGGVDVKKGATFTMENGVIGGTTADAANTAPSGGGVYLYGTGVTFNMQNGTISSNVTSRNNGGGVFVSKDATFTMQNGSIANNVSAKHGGGVYVQDGTFNMDGGAISGNEANVENYEDGGGVFVIGNFTMSNGTISGNKAYRGAGVQVGDLYPNGKMGPATFTMTGGTIGGTTADAANIATYGGGVNVWSTGTFNLRSGSIIGNEANGTVDENGGGVHSNGTFNVSGDPIVKSNTREIQGSTYADNVDSSDKAINVVGALRDAVEIVVNRTSKTKITGVATYYSAIPNDDESVTLRAPTGSSGGETDVAVKSVSLDKTSLTLVEGNSETLTATVTPDNAINKTVTWSSSNTAVATVENGVVKAVSAGTVTITATAGGKSATCAVTVSAAYVPATAVQLSQETAEIRVGETLQLTATVKPDNATDKTVRWSSSNAEIATVDANGLVTGLKTGEVSIFAMTADNRGATCGVTVTAAQTGETKYALTVNNGTGSGEYAEGEVVTITADPAAQGKMFYRWEGADGLEFVGGTAANEATAKFKMPSRTVTLTAAYIPQGVIDIVITPNGGEFTDSVEVTLASTRQLVLSDLKLYYTTDGTGAYNSETRKVYTGPFTLTETCTVNVALYTVSKEDGSESIYTTKSATFTKVGGETGGETPTPTPEAPRYYYSSGSGSTGAGGLSAVQNDPNGKSATDYSGGIYGLLFRTNAALSAFRGVQVDGVTIDAANYSVEGNEVYLKAVYLQTLANGKHTLTVLSGEGDATAQFTVGGVVSAPKTADAGALAYLGLALSSYVGTALVTRRKKEF